MKNSKIIAIVGPTASGKTALSIALAQRFSGEIISADSRQVYRGLDLGSGKVTHEEMACIPHHLLDVADPTTTVYTAQDFTTAARTAARAIIERGSVPIVVGGTFLYLEMFLGNMSAPAVPPNPQLRAELETLTNPELYQKLKLLDPARAETIDKDNPRRLIRAIEIVAALGHVPAVQAEKLYAVLTIGLSLPKETIHSNIENRLKIRLQAGMVAEVENLLAAGVSPQRLEALGLEYRYITRHLKGEIDYEKMSRDILNKSRQFAKRQLTWLKRDDSINWFEPKNTEAIYSTVQQFLKD